MVLPPGLGGQQVVEGGDRACATGPRSTSSGTWRTGSSSRPRSARRPRSTGRGRAGRSAGSPAASPGRCARTGSRARGRRGRSSRSRAGSGQLYCRLVTSSTSPRRFDSSSSGQTMRKLRAGVVRCDDLREVGRQGLHVAHHDRPPRDVDAHGMPLERRQLERHAAVPAEGVRVHGDALLSRRAQRQDVRRRAALAVEQLFGPVRAQPLLEDLEVRRVLLRVLDGNLVRAERAFDRNAVDLLRAAEALRRPQDQHRPPRPLGRPRRPRAPLDLPDLAVRPGEGRIGVGVERAPPLTKRTA